MRLRLHVRLNAFKNALASAYADQAARQQAGQQGQRHAEVERQARAAMAAQGTGYVEQVFVNEGVDPDVAKQAANTPEMQNYVKYGAEISKLETERNVNFNLVPMDQQTDMMRTAINNAGLSRITEQYRLPVSVPSDQSDSSNTGGLSQDNAGPPPDPNPVVVTTTGDKSVPFLHVAADVLDLGQEAINKSVDMIGRPLTITGMLGLQVALGGVPRTVVSLGTNHLTQGLRNDATNEVSGLLADKAFGVNDEGRTVEDVSDINKVSHVLGGFAVNTIIAMPQTIVDQAITDRLVLKMVDKARNKAVNTAANQAIQTLTKVQQRQIAVLRSGGEVIVKDANEARTLLEHMPEVKPAVQERILPNPNNKMADGFADPPGTYRGDLINKKDPLSPVHPDVANPMHANNPHYNIRLPNGDKAAIIIGGEE